MSVPVRLAAFVAMLAAVLLAGLGVGRAVGPVLEDEPSASHESAETDDAADDAADGGESDGHDDGVSDDHDGAANGTDDAGHGDEPSGVTGLAVSEAGYTLRPETTVLRTGEQPFAFAVTGPDGAPVTGYDLTHERELHLVVVRRDGSGFQHLHPERAADGTWSTPLTLDSAGAYRAYADFAPSGQPARTLAVDLLVPGELAPEAWPAPAKDTTTDGFTVTLDGHLDVGADAELRFDVMRDGRPVELEPYLGAAGHLVVLREGDLGYLHVHPEGDELSFAAAAPSEGRYRLYLQFQVDGAVHTAELTAEAKGAHA